MSKNISLLLLCITATSLVCFPVYAASGKSRSPHSGLVLVLVGGLSIRDIVAPGLPHLSQLLRKGSWALVNVRTAARIRDPILRTAIRMEPAAVTLGAGTPAVGQFETRGAINYRANDTNTTDIFRVALPGIKQLTQANCEAAYHATPGLLGETLKAAGIQCSVFGNSDLPGEPHRESVCALMDRFGQVDYGDVDSSRLNITDLRYPYGMKNNVEYLVSAAQRNGSQHQVVLLDFGDALRADIYAHKCIPEQAASVRRAAVRRLDELIGKLERRMPVVHNLMLLSACPRTYTDVSGEKLGFIAIQGAEFPPGLLTSPSTRRDGVVTLCDVAPTALTMVGVDIPAQMSGRPAKPSDVNVEDTGKFLLHLNLDAGNQAERQILMRATSVVSIAVVVLCTVTLLSSRLPKLRTVAKWVSLLPIAAFLALLYGGCVYSGGLPGSAVVATTLAIAIIAAAVALSRQAMTAYRLICALLLASIVADLLRGSPLIASSVAGYSLVEGARFYGLGNELMGAMLGTALALFGSSQRLEHLSRRTLILLGASISTALFVISGSPMLGANVGGAIASVTAGVTLVLVTRGFRSPVRVLSVMAIVALAGIVGILAFDALRPSSEQSHAGRLVAATFAGNAPSMVQTVVRKITLNLMLTQVSPWSKLLGATLVCSALLWRRLVRANKEPERTRLRNAALIASCAAMAGAFVFNDSGVVAAATCAVVTWTWLLLESTMLERR